MTSASAHSRRRRARWGAWLIAIGIVGILWGVFHVLGHVGAPESRSFADRLPYNQVKPRLQQSFLGGLVRALFGLSIAMLGGRLRSSALAPETEAADSAAR